MKLRQGYFWRDILRHPVIERADYIVAHLGGDEWQILKYKGDSNTQFIDTATHNELLMEVNSPIVLDIAYLLLDEYEHVVTERAERSSR